MNMPLDGIKIVDWTIWIQGPLATAMLADLGAEVIKIEERVGGDPSRGVTRMVGHVTSVTTGPNFWLEHCNRNKKSIAIDLKKEKGKRIVYQLVEKSDVFVQNFRRGIASKLGLDYKTLSQYNPKLIYATASGYGARGPESAIPSFDYVGLARSGIMTMVGEPSMPPLYLTGGIADHMGAIMLAYSVLAALVARNTHGLGQEIEVSLLGSMIALQSLNVAGNLLLGHEFPRRSRTKPGNPLSNHYCCADGKWLVLAMLQADRYWPDLCKAMGIPELEKDPRFENMDQRAQNDAELVSILDQIFAQKRREKWLRIFKEAGDLIYAPVNSISDLSKDQQVLANDYITEFDHPAMGKIKTVGSPIQFSKTPVKMRLPAPEHGEHTEQILIGLGYTWDDISQLKEEEVII